MLSQSVEYALRAAVYLASEAQAARTSAQIAAATRVPRAYLVKLLQGLGRAGLVKAQRGLNGGTMLALPADGVTILQIVNAVEPIERIRDCPLGLASHGVNLCPLHRRVDEALAAMERAFADTTLAELLAEPTGSPPLCELAAAP